MKSFRSRLTFWISVSLILLSACAVLSLSSGSIGIPPWEWFSLEENSMEKLILFQLRGPRVLAAIAIGGMLSLSGCLLQGIFKNPLVEPYTLGISAGASLGVAVAFASGWQIGTFSPAGLFALAGALGTSFLLLAFYRIRPDINSLLLSGIMLGILLSACTTLAMSLSSPQDISRIIYWTMGSLDNNSPLQALSLCGLAFAGLVVATLLSQRVNILNMGLETARHLGVETRVLVPLLIILASCMTAASVAAAGIIGFIGLVVPHILRSLAGNDYRILIPASFLCGGGFTLFCDWISRTVIRPGELPVGVVTGILGGGVFIYLLLKSKKQSYA